MKWIGTEFWLLLILNENIDSIFGIARFDLLIDRGNFFICPTYFAYWSA